MAERAKPIRMTTERGRIPKIRPVGQKWAPHEDLYYFILELSWARFFLLIATVFLGINVLFALAYLADPHAIANMQANTFEYAFFFSVQTLATIGYGAMAPSSLYGHVLVTVEAFLGLLGLTVITGMTFAKFARPQARVLFCEKVVVTPRDGIPHLMFRMANWRHNQIIEAQLRVIVLVTEKTAEGERMRVPVDLPLVRDRTMMFTLSWTAMHRIDKDSLFYGADALRRLQQCEAEIYLSLTGLDATIAQTVHARYRYELDDIVWNARFADVLTVLPDGTRQVDYQHFHQVVPIDKPAVPSAAS